MDAEVAFLQGFCAGTGLRLQLEGSIGFGRECVGLLDADRDVYLAWDHGCGPTGAPNAYHKSDYVAVLGEGTDAIVELAEWVRAITAEPFEIARVLKDCDDLASLVYGYRDELVIRRPVRSETPA